MYATLGKPFIFLSINLQNDTEFLTNIDPEKFDTPNIPNWDVINPLSSDEYLTLVNQNAGPVARMCKRRMAAFEEYIKNKEHSFLINYIVLNYFFKLNCNEMGAHTCMLWYR